MQNLQYKQIKTLTMLCKVQSLTTTSSKSESLVFAESSIIRDESFFGFGEMFLNLYV